MKTHHVVLSLDGTGDRRYEMVIADDAHELERQNTRMRDALVRLRDCDWIVTPHDRMDAVRNIARDALK
jgi:hypothetical protein